MGIEAMLFTGAGLAIGLGALASNHGGEGSKPTMHPVSDPNPHRQAAPIIPPPAPVIADPAPVIADPAPVIADPAPVIAAPAPVIAAPAPVDDRRAYEDLIGAPGFLQEKLSVGGGFDLELAEDTAQILWEMGKTEVDVDFTAHDYHEIERAFFIKLYRTYNFSDDDLRMARIWSTQEVISFADSYLATISEIFIKVLKKRLTGRIRDSFNEKVLRARQAPQAAQQAAEQREAERLAAERQAAERQAAEQREAQQEAAQQQAAQQQGGLEEVVPEEVVPEEMDEEWEAGRQAFQQEMAERREVQRLEAEQAREWAVQQAAQQQAAQQQPAQKRAAQQRAAQQQAAQQQPAQKRAAQQRLAALQDLLQRAAQQPAAGVKRLGKFGL